MILPDPEVAFLKSALRCWEWFGYISTAVVGLGCIGEYIAEFTSIPTCESSRRKISKLSLIILILGIAGELLSTARTSQLSGQLIADIEAHAGDAEEKAAEANERAANAELELTRQSNRVRLLWGRKAVTRERLKVFKGQKAEVIACDPSSDDGMPNDRELSDLAFKYCRVTRGIRLAN